MKRKKNSFALPENKRKRFTFGCSDDQCRSTKNPIVSGVKYHQLAEETEIYRQIRFRAPASNPHLDTCIWVLGDRSRTRLIQVVDGDEGKPREERPKATNVIDVFQPKDFDELVASNLVQKPSANASSINGRPQAQMNLKCRQGKERHNAEEYEQALITMWNPIRDQRKKDICLSVVTEKPWIK